MVSERLAPLVAAVVVVLLAMPVDADDWQWRRVAWEGVGVQSVACPPDSADVIYVALYNWELPVDEIGVYRPSSGLWAVKGVTRVYYGSSGDIPVTR